MGGKVKLTIETVKDRFKEVGFTLLEDTYFNNKTPMLCVCDEGHKTKKSVANLKTGCISCGRERTESYHRLTYKLVYDYFKENGCELISTEYQNAKQLLKYRCKCGNVSEIRYDNFKQGKRCNYCRYQTIAEKRKHSIEYVRDCFEKNGCMLISTEYINESKPLKYVCKCGKKSVINFSNFQSGQRCRSCGVEKLSGKNSPFWKSELTDEHRLKGRNIAELREWRKKVFDRDGYMCVNCGDTGYLNAHHINSYDVHAEKRFDVNNGATLCIGCHKDFHDNFGRGRNTEDQFREWMDSGQAAASHFDF